MEYRIYKLFFDAGLHIGKGKLEDGEMTVCADTLFSALCHEALKQGGEEQLKDFVQCIEDGQILLSDLMPFDAEGLFIPKPITSRKAERNDDSTAKKTFKNLKYIPATELETYLSGAMSPDIPVQRQRNLGKYEMRARGAVRDGFETEPYPVGVFNFSEGCGLYLIAGFADTQDQALLENLMEGLSYSGIGGKVTSGLGRFSYATAMMPDIIKKRLIPSGENKMYMALSVCMADQKELNSALDQAEYVLTKRSGFICSQNFAETNRKKSDFYLFKAGSCFKNPFSGALPDVGIGGNHPVYRYAKAMFLEV